jgi:hypothetical protein
MLIEVKVKVARIIDGKTRKRTETYLKEGCELFVEAEQAVMRKLTDEQVGGLIDEFEIQSLKISPIKEVCDQWIDDYTLSGYPPFLATLKETYHLDDGSEKTLKYKVLLWANSHSQALQRVQELARQGYDMQIEGIKQTDFEYLTGQEGVTND